MNFFPHFISLHLLGWPLHLYFALNVLQCHASNIGSGWTNTCLSVSIYIGFCIEQIGSRQFAILTSHTNQRGWKYSVPYILRSIPHFCTCAQICSSIKKVKSLSHIWLFVAPWTLAYQAPPSIEFFRQEYWSGLPFPSPMC